MSSFWNFVFGFLLIVLWILAGGFVTRTNINLTSYKNQDIDLHQAYWYTFWAAFVTWFLIALFILLVILSVIGVVALFGSGVGEAGVAEEGVAEEGSAGEGSGGEEGYTSRYLNSQQGQDAENTGISWFTIGFFLLAIILVSITGVLSAIAASDIAASQIYDPTIPTFKTAYDDCIIAASISLGAVGLLVLGFIIYFIVGRIQQNKIKAQRESMNYDANS